MHLELLKDLKLMDFEGIYNVFSHPNTLYFNIIYFFSFQLDPGNIANKFLVPAVSLLLDQTKPLRRDKLVFYIFDCYPNHQHQSNILIRFSRQIF